MKEIYELRSDFDSMSRLIRQTIDKTDEICKKEKDFFNEVDQPTSF
ncbi:hypothetical protein [Bacillus infantis]